MPSLVHFMLITSSFLINLHLSVGANDTVYGNCTQPITCGEVQSNISYPFWGVNRPDSCGKSGFQVECQGSVPMLNMRNVSFRILGMESFNNPPTIKVARDDYWGTLCPSSYVSTYLDFSLFDYSFGLQNLSLFYGCNASLSSATLKGNMITSDCNSSSISVSYLTEAQRGNLSSNPVTSRVCENEILVPVFNTVAAALEDNRTSVEIAIDGGFDLVVQNYDDSSCVHCKKRGGVCGQDPDTISFACYYPSSSGPIFLRRLLIGIPIFGFFVSIVCILVHPVLFGNIKALHGKKVLDIEACQETKELDIEAFIQTHGLIAPRRYSYSDVLRMTNSFEEQIGKGGYGIVYKGRLSDGLLVAVKVLSESNGDGEEFINEVASIGRTSHVNVVTLSGFCYQMNKRALIYEYMPNGSLDKFINNKGSFKANCLLDWKTLSDIAVGVARGLEYLHRGCNTRILHFDIKPQNILLDKDFCPKISDFGLAKLCKTKESIVSIMGTRGTAGYIAPEVFSRSFGGVSHKSDVYSYGMLVLEMVGARRNLNSEVSDHTSEMFPHYVYKDLELENDESMFGAIPAEENETVRKMILVSLGCIQTIPSDRPSMSKVAEMLEGPLHSLTVPPKPFLFHPKVSEIVEQSSDIEVEEISDRISRI